MFSVIFAHCGESGSTLHMPRKIIWAVFWMTLMLWLGGLWGCAGTGDDQNYEMLNEDEQLFRPEPPILQSRQDIGVELDVALNESTQKLQAGESVEESSALPIAESPQPTDAQPNYILLAELATGEPSLKGIGRSHWSRVTVTPSYGTTVHHPIYFSDTNVRSKPVPVEKPQAVLDSHGADESVLMIDAYDEAALLAALEGAWAGNISSSTNQWGLLWQPLKFCLDLFSLPVNAVFAPPLGPVTTPSQE